MLLQQPPSSSAARVPARYGAMEHEELTLVPVDGFNAGYDSDECSPAFIFSDDDDIDDDDDFEDDDDYEDEDDLDDDEDEEDDYEEDEEDDYEDEEDDFEDEDDEDWDDEE